MSVQQRRKYDPEFKRNAVQLTEEPGRTVAGVAENLSKIYRSGSRSMEHGIYRKSIDCFAETIDGRISLEVF